MCNLPEVRIPAASYKLLINNMNKERYNLRAMNKELKALSLHIIKLDVLEDYLFNIIKFDTPSTTRHRFGSVFKERDGKFFFKLNMQLRL